MIQDIRTNLQEITSQVCDNLIISSDIYIWALFFLLGTLTVASLSDLKRMAAQKEFMEVWLAFAVIVFLFDLYSLKNPTFLALKWGLIVVLALLSWRKLGILFKLYEMDVAAVCAVMSLLNPLYILAFYGVLFVTDRVMQRILMKFGRGRNYPFLPVVLVATVIIILLILIFA